MRFVTRGVPVTDMDWEIDAPGLVETLERVHREYTDLPLYVTENGSAFVDLTLEEWRRVLSVNLDGVMVTLREAAKHMVERGEGGALVTVSSASAYHGAPRNQPYATGKTALLGLTRALAVELARYGIRCNAVCPGWTDTEILDAGRANERFVAATVGRTPVRRWADPDEFGDVAVYLAQKGLTFHTGDELVVDGGYTKF